MNLQEFRAYIRTQRAQSPAPSNAPRVYRLPANSLSGAWATTPIRKVEDEVRDYPLGMKLGIHRACSQARLFGVRSRV
jgi:hypothetical protein